MSFGLQMLVVINDDLQFNPNLMQSVPHYTMKHKSEDFQKFPKISFKNP
jgi:hypothetical protein